MVRWFLYHSFRHADRRVCRQSSTHSSLEQEERVEDESQTSVDQAVGDASR